MALQDIDALEQDVLAEKSREYILAERQCRISLSKDWPRDVPLEWHPGGSKGQKSVIPLRPGKSVVQPLPKAKAWFGPFDVYFEIRTADEKKKELLRDLWRSEKERYLNRYDYPRGNGRGAKPDMTPSGPHRSPDVTVTILEADGTESEPLRLHELYKIGEFDPLKDSFVTKEAVEER